MSIFNMVADSTDLGANLINLTMKRYVSTNDSPDDEFVGENRRKVKIGKNVEYITEKYVDYLDNPQERTVRLTIFPEIAEFDNSTSWECYYNRDFILSPDIGGPKQLFNTFCIRPFSNYGKHRKHFCWRKIEAQLKKLIQTHLRLGLKIEFILSYDEGSDFPIRINYEILMFAEEAEQKKIIKIIKECDDSFSWWDIVPFVGNVRTIGAGVRNIKKGETMSGAVKVALGVSFLAADVISLGQLGSLVGGACKLGAGVVAKEAVKTTGKEAVVIAAQELGKNVGKEATKEVASLAAKEVGKKAAKEVASQAAKEVGKKAAKEVASQAAKEVGKKAAKEVASQAAKEVGKKAAKEVVSQAAKEVGKKAVKEVASQAAKEVGKKAAKGVATQATKEVGKKAAKEAVEYGAQQLSKNVVETAAKGQITEVLKTVGSVLNKIPISKIRATVHTLIESDAGKQCVDFIEEKFIKKQHPCPGMRCDTDTDYNPETQQCPGDTSNNLNSKTFNDDVKTENNQDVKTAVHTKQGDDIIKDKPSTSSNKNVMLGNNPDNETKQCDDNLMINNIEDDKCNDHDDDTDNIKISEHMKCEDKSEIITDSHSKNCDNTYISYYGDPLNKVHIVGTYFDWRKPLKNQLEKFLLDTFDLTPNIVNVSYNSKNIICVECSNKYEIEQLLKLNRLLKMARSDIYFTSILQIKDFYNFN